MISRTFHLSQTFNAPLTFVFEWCTDFGEEDDGKLIGSSSLRHIVDRSKKRALWISHYTDSTGKEMEGIRIVTLKSPNSWHLNAAGDDYLEMADYHLTKSGRHKTKFDMIMRLKYKAELSESEEEWKKATLSQWDSYKSHLETEYNGSGSNKF